MLGEMMSQAASPIPELLLSLVDVIEQANQLLVQFYENSAQLDIQQKSDQSPVTTADLAAHHYIVDQLAILTPDIPVLSEESADHSSRHQWPRFWLLDPLDGTKEFINRTGEFTVNLALIEQGQVGYAFIGVPVKAQVYASDGHHAWRIDAFGWEKLVAKPARESWTLAISREANKQQGERYQRFLQSIHAPHQLINAGSAYKFCLMAEGQIDVYPRLHPTSEWDTAAGQGLLQVLGGGLIDEKGRAFCYNQRARLENGVFVAYRCADHRKQSLAAMQAALDHLD